MKRILIGAASVMSLAFTSPVGAQESLPILDVHLHALPATGQGPPPVPMCAPFPEFPTISDMNSYRQGLLGNLPCDDPIWSPMTDEEVMQGTIEIMERRNVYGVLSGTPARVAEWSSAAPNRFIRGLGFSVGSVSPDSLRSLHATGAVEVLAEVTNQYRGIAPDDPRMDPYWSLAEELDLPVGIHIGPGPPGVAYMGAAGYRARLHSPLALEEILMRHPDLRLYVMHAAYPMLEDLLAVLYTHPQLHVGTGVIVYTQPRAAFYRYLQRLVEAGFANRIMFGSDQMVWPETLEIAIQVIEDAPFLTEQRKRDILYNNAARFLKLSAAEIEAHHSG